MIGGACSQNCTSKTSSAIGHKPKQKGDKLRIEDNIVRSMLTGGEEGSEIIWRSADMLAPFAIDAKGGEKLDEKGSMI